MTLETLGVPSPFVTWVGLQRIIDLAVHWPASLVIAVLETIAGGILASVGSGLLEAEWRRDASR